MVGVAKRSKAIRQIKPLRLRYERRRGADEYVARTVASHERTKGEDRGRAREEAPPREQ